jgi:peptide chain release factor 1
VSLANQWGYFDSNEIILELQFGEGGDDSKIFVDELFSAYIKYAKSLGFSTELLYSSYGHMMAKIRGKEAGKAFLKESGKHVVQRIPPTETNGRRQTSVVSVAVLPIKKEAEKDLIEKDLQVEAVNLGGAGGQHQNRTYSGCRITHLPTRLKVVINGRDYHSNEREARKILAARLYDLNQQKINTDYAKFRREQMGGGHRGDKIRTYNFLNSRVVDHRSGKQTRNIKAVMKGQFQEIIG